MRLSFEMYINKLKTALKATPIKRPLLGYGVTQSLHSAAVKHILALLDPGWVIIRVLATKSCHVMYDYNTHYVFQKPTVKKLTFTYLQLMRL